MLKLAALAGVPLGAVESVEAVAPVRDPDEVDADSTNKAIVIGLPEDTDN